MNTNHARGIMLWAIILLSIPSSAQTKLSPEEIKKNNLQTIRGLQPAIVWENFATICSIPHCSGNEDGIIKLIIDSARANQLEWTLVRKNLIVRIPASPGLESLPSKAIQGHVDMVCQKNGGRNNDDIFPIEIIPSGDGKFMANGSSLGADNGIGIAMMIALMTTHKMFKHPMIELIFTIEEELGLVGAKDFNSNNIKSKIMYNIDDETESVLTIGCAGGRVINTILTPKFFTFEESTAFKIELSGFLGGHSGADIDKGHGNAIKVMGDLLLQLQKQGFISSISGGSKPNAIPSEAQATIVVPNEGEFIQRFEQVKMNILAQYPEEQLNIVLKNMGTGTRRVLRERDQKNLLNLIYFLPNGVINMEPMDQSLVRTSNNIGVLEMRNDSIIITGLTRSSTNRQMDSVVKIINLIGSSYQAKTKVIYGFDPWEPNNNTQTLAHAVAVYEKLFGKKPKISTTHGGLEAGIFAKIPGMEVIACGPTVGGAHSPSESIDIISVEKCFLFLKRLIEIE